jgi:ABC-type proline/glycine betaine transport system permease subunit
MMGSLKLFGMRSAFDEIVTTAVKRQHEPQRLVGDLLKAEIDEKLARSIKYQMTLARLPLAKDVADFAFVGMGAIVSVDRQLIEVGRMFRLSPFALTRRVLLPAILPAWIVALRTGLGLGFMFVVAAEIMGASEGLGYLLVDGQQLGKPDEILVALITFAIVGQICDTLLVAATRPLVQWQDTDRRQF